MTTNKFILYFIIALLAAFGVYVLVKVLAALSFVFILGFFFGVAATVGTLFKLNRIKKSG